MLVLVPPMLGVSVSWWRFVGEERSLSCTTSESHLSVTQTGRTSHLEKGVSWIKKKKIKGFFFGWSRQQIRFLCKAYTILKDKPYKGNDRTNRKNKLRVTLFEHLFGAALPDFSQLLCTAWLLHLWVMQLCQEQSEPNPFQSMDFYFFSLMAQTATSDCQIQAGYFL